MALRKTALTLSLLAWFLAATADAAAGRSVWTRSDQAEVKGTRALHQPVYEPPQRMQSKWDGPDITKHPEFQRMAREHEGLKANLNHLLDEHAANLAEEARTKTTNKWLKVMRHAAPVLGLGLAVVGVPHVLTAVMPAHSLLQGLSLAHHGATHSLVATGLTVLGVAAAANVARWLPEAVRNQRIRNAQTKEWRAAGKLPPSFWSR